MRYLMPLCLSIALLGTASASAQTAIPESARKAIAQSEVTISLISNGKPIKALGIADVMRVWGDPTTTSIVLLNAYTAPYASNFLINVNGRPYTGQSVMFDTETGAVMLAFDGAALSPAKVPKIFAGLEINKDYIVSSLDTNGDVLLQTAKMVDFQRGRTLLSKLQGSTPVRNGNVYTMAGEWVGFVQGEGTPNDNYIYVVDEFSINNFKNFSMQLSFIWSDGDAEFKKLGFDNLMLWARTASWNPKITVQEFLSVNQGFLTEERTKPNVKAIGNKIRTDFRAHASEGAKQQIYLDCFLQTSDGTRRALDIHVDLIAKTANGWPAQIDDAKISFAPSSGKTGIIVNRYTGSISMDMVTDDGVLRKGQNIGTGNCQLRGKDKKF